MALLGRLGKHLMTPLRIFAEWNPISAVTQGSRELFGNVPAIAGEPAARQRAFGSAVRAFH
jgi:hypothetical protein